jgi:hypothetical protein
MAQEKILRFELAVVAISLTEWIKSCKTSEQLAIACHFSQKNLLDYFGEDATRTIIKLMELCNKQKEYLEKYKIPEPREIF